MSIIKHLLEMLFVFIVLVLLTPIILIAFGVAGIIDIWDTIFFNRI